METTPSSHERPEHQTAGSQQRPDRQLTGAVLSFDLAQELASLQQEESWQRGDRNARTLVEDSGLRVVLTVLAAGARLREHRTDGWVSIQALQGYIRVETPDETIDLLPGRLVTLRPGVPHDVEGIELSGFLLTIA